MITIVNYGLGNLGSVANMFKRIGVRSEITSDLDSISRAEKILLPGVGAFDAAMERIRSAGMDAVLREKAMVEKVPFLGICLGMQLLTESSEEGNLPGLGFIKGRTKRFKLNDPSLKIPHMGWNVARFQRESPLTYNLTGEQRFYFVHSYYVECANKENVVATTYHGLEFDSIIHHENVYGGQFHPEKSHTFGMNFLKNFSKI